METAEHREPYELRGSRTDLGAPGGESPPGDSTGRAVPNAKLSDREGSNPAVLWWPWERPESARMNRPTRGSFLRLTVQLHGTC